MDRQYDMSQLVLAASTTVRSVLQHPWMPHTLLFNIPGLFPNRLNKYKMSDIEAGETSGLNFNTAVLSTCLLRLMLRLSTNCPSSLEKYRWDHSEPKCFFQPLIVLNQPCKIILIFLEFLSKYQFSDPKHFPWLFLDLEQFFPDFFLTCGNPKHHISVDCVTIQTQIFKNIRRKVFLVRLTELQQAAFWVSLPHSEGFPLAPVLVFTLKLSRHDGTTRVSHAAWHNYTWTINWRNGRNIQLWNSTYCCIFPCGGNRVHRHNHRHISMAVCPATRERLCSPTHWWRTNRAVE